MSKSDEQQLAKLIRKNVAKAAAKGPKLKKQYDPTLAHTQEQDGELKSFFSEMKKREF